MSTDAMPPAAAGAVDVAGWRQACRMTAASAACLFLAKVMDWPYAAFFAVYPILLLGLVPVCNLRIFAQFGVSSPVAIMMSGMLAILGNVSPYLASLIFGLFAAGCFTLMAKGTWFLVGALSLVSTSILVHLASYPQIDGDMLKTAQLLATFVAIIASLLVHAAFPERRAAPASPTPAPAERPQRIALGALCATASYIAFQLLDLPDSLSAQAATVLVLFPMTLSAGRRASWQRALGTLAGSACALASELLLHAHPGNLLLLLSLYVPGLLYFGLMHARERAGPAVGLAAATALAVLAGQLTPDGDIIGTSLYRFSSVAVALGTTLLFMFVVDTWLSALFRAGTAEERGRR